MRQVQYHRYGKSDVLEIAEVEIPRVSSTGLLVRVYYVGLNPKDAALRNGFLKQLRNNRFPKLTGFDFSGEVIQVGKGVIGYQKGDLVYGYLEDLNGGAAADYITVKPHQIAKVSFDLMLAASMPCTYLTAFQSFRKVRLKKGDRVMIYGASGGVGTAAIQIGKQLGAHITAVSSAKNQSYCLTQGADDFISYDQENPFESTGYDVFVQVHVITGDKYKDAKKVLRGDGKFVTMTPNPLRKILNPFRRNKIYPIVVRANHDDLTHLSHWASEGKIQPQVSELFDLERIIEAHESVHTQHTKGKIVLKVN